ncbi:hypothetical protein MJG53_015810 [Ovis ammon polii x Ovis aries]|uniref:Uncharacterized protein n=1 Tax=Ovis ammon polii x Ovis aries TaxID=2918886 RepID=A0ACB9UBZ9_9CETA|nr:hypothetical protein MJG53_015810 [Ovis ammon polii x Ovis aries]
MGLDTGAPERAERHISYEDTDASRKQLTGPRDILSGTPIVSPAHTARLGQPEGALTRTVYGADPVIGHTVASLGRDVSSSNTFLETARYKLCLKPKHEECDLSKLAHLLLRNCCLFLSPFSIARKMACCMALRKSVTSAEPVFSSEMKTVIPFFMGICCIYQYLNKEWRKDTVDYEIAPGLRAGYLCRMKEEGG